eukprot:1144391-Pelagomonas_calceolata.AAC.2
MLCLPQSVSACCSQASKVQQDQEQLSSNMKKSKVVSLATPANSPSEPILCCMPIGNPGR